MMPKKIRKCNVCNSFTMHSSCCGAQTDSPHPPKYSPEDRYARYRRMSKGLL